MDVSGEELHEILREIDTNMNGQVELDEYLQVCVVKLYLRNVFKSKRRRAMNLFVFLVLKFQIFFSISLLVVRCFYLYFRFVLKNFIEHTKDNLALTETV